MSKWGWQRVKKTSHPYTYYIIRVQNIALILFTIIYLCIVSSFSFFLLHFLDSSFYFFHFNIYFFFFALDCTYHKIVKPITFFSVRSSFVMDVEAMRTNIKFAMCNVCFAGELRTPCDGITESIETAYNMYNNIIWTLSVQWCYIWFAELDMENNYN